MAEKEQTETTNRKSKGQSSSRGSGVVYGLGFIGALIYFLQQADTFWQGALGILEAFIWPVLLVYHMLQFLKV